MRLSRKASMELSINAIVILVLAIAVLGLGLAFTKGWFSKLGERIDIPEPNIPATADEPIVLPTGDEISIKKGKETSFTVNFYNDFDSGTIIPKLECGNVLTVDGTTQYVAVGEYKGFKFIIPAATSQQTTVQSVVCTISFCLAVNNVCPATGAQKDTKQVILRFR